MKKQGLLVVNLGTPDEPGKKEVRRYLTEFLNDPRVIDIPWVLQKILVNLIIIPFRVGNSTKLYKRLWTADGSPLLIFLNNLVDKLANELGSKYRLYKAMRYGKPRLTETLEQIRKDGIEELTILPLFPQYASSTTGSIVEKVFGIIKKWEAIPGVKVIGQYYDDPMFVKAFAGQIAKYNLKEYDHVIFSYHGLPNRQINKIHPEHPCEGCTCSKEMPEFGALCYKATCYETTRLIAKELNLPEEKYTVGFQSRLSKNWLSPFTDEVVTDLAKNGAKKVLITAPSFVADCLETIVELQYEYKLLFKEHGGQELTLVESLNDTDEWVGAIAKLVT
ncbi:MAG: ferrochelatase [Mariniphaga sp.]